MNVERRRSPRHLVGEEAEVHVGPVTVTAEVSDVSQHGMGLRLPPEVKAKAGDVVWILINAIASYAITATVRRTAGDNHVGVEFDEILEGEAREKIESLPLA